MQLKVQTLINILEKLAPKHLALEWDHVGLQLGNPQGNVAKIYVTLDVNEDVLNEVIAMGADFIVTHHPFIFKPLAAIRTDQTKGRLIERALQAGIAIYAAHTNLDMANGGVNDALAERLGIIEARVLRPAGHTLVSEGQQYGLGRVGSLPYPCSLAEFCHDVKEQLEIPFVRVTGDMAKTIKKVALCGGAGSNLIYDAAFAGADVLVTGDLKYHEAQDAETLSLAVIDAGHDGTEKVIIPVLCDYLKQQLAAAGYNAEITASTIKTTPWCTL